MTKLLQKILFPKDEKLQAHWGLFYRAPRLALDATCTQLHIPSGTAVDFATYLNGFSIQKWKLYTPLRSVTLRITLQGRGRIYAIGYHLNPVMPDRHEFSSQEFDFASPTEIVLDFPTETSEQLLSFEILPFSDTVFYGGAFYGDFEESDVREVNLCLATTTCRKEGYITKNVRLLKEELLSEASEIREHFFVHVVDNGRTLTKEEIEGYHVTLHPNKNVGGSGGFARGMIEAMRQTPEATNVLLMDDDVLVLPESIRRTYTLLSVLKDEWKEAFVSGAMLEFGAMNIQHEDIGTITERGDFIPAKHFPDMYWLENILNTNNELAKINNQYAAWWYCCIPVSQIKKNGLPLPLFIRGDDSEYGLRCRPKIITMTGFCVWHLGFVGKYNVSMDFYQPIRNMLIAKATTGVMQNSNIIHRLKRLFCKQLLEYCYNGAEILLLALEDYMKGPSFIEQDLGERLLKEHSAYNEKLKPLSEFDIEVRLERVYDNPPLKKIRKLFYYGTLNFHLFIPRFMLKKDVGVIGFDWSHQSGIQYRREKLLAVNPFDRTAALRVQDRKQCRKLLRRFFWDLLSYKFRHKRIERAYAAKRDWLTSEEFWLQYLEITSQMYRGGGNT